MDAKHTPPHYRRAVIGRGQPRLLKAVNLHTLLHSARLHFPSCGPLAAEPLDRSCVRHRQPATHQFIWTRRLSCKQPDPNPSSSVSAEYDANGAQQSFVPAHSSCVHSGACHHQVLPWTALINAGLFPSQSALRNADPWMAALNTLTLIPRCCACVPENSPACDRSFAVFCASCDTSAEFAASALREAPSCDS
jgi:hypothetical protein